MATQATTERVGASDLSEGDEVTVYVNDRAAGHLGTSSFPAVVEHAVFSDSISFRPTPQLQETHVTHTWYADIGYIHGYHDGLERHSDIGKVRKVERR